MAKKGDLNVFHLHAIFDVGLSFSYFFRPDLANTFPLIFCAKKRTFCCAMTNNSGDNMFRLNANFDVGLNLVHFSVPCLANINLFLVL